MLIKDLPDEHIEAVCALFLQVFSVDVSPLVWRWKYHGTAQLGAINLVAYDAVGTLVGHAGAIVLPGVDQEQPRAMVQICDVMVASHRRGGAGGEAVYPALMRALRTAINARFPGAYAYGFPGKRPFLLGERLGFYQRAYDIVEQVIQPQVKSKPWWSLYSVHVLEQGALAKDSARLQRLWGASTKSNGAPVVVRDAAYVLWRYAQHPTRRYTVLVLRRAWRDLACWVVAVEGEALRVVDALGDAARSEHGLEALQAWAGQQGFTRLLCWHSVTNAAQVDFGIVAGQFALGTGEVLRIPSFMPGDLDIF